MKGSFIGKCTIALSAMVILLGVAPVLGGDVYSVTADGQTFDAYFEDYDGQSWILIGRGRDMWEMDIDGQGSPDDVSQGLKTTAAFSPKVLSDAIINDLLDQAGMTFPGDVQVRIMRATTKDGTGTYQDSRWTDLSGTSFTFDFDKSPNITCKHEIKNAGDTPLTDDDGYAGASAPISSDTYDNYNEQAGDTGARIFTWPHESVPGFRYGSSIKGTARPTDDFLCQGSWAVPYTEVYIPYEAPAQGGISFSDLVTSNVTDKVASLYAMVNTNLTSATVVWNTEDKGDTNLTVWVNSASATGTTPGTITGNATGLAADTQYYFRFYGEDSAVPTNGWSKAKTFATALTDDASKPAFTDAVASYSSATLEWDDNADTETGYILQRSTNDVDYVVVAELDENITTHTDEGLLSGTTYYYQLAATNDVNESSTAFSACVTNTITLISWSDVGVSNITTDTASPYATVSANLTASWLVWDTSDKGDTDLQLWAGKSGDMGDQSAGEVTGNAINLTPDTEYFFRFYGANAETYGWSQAATFATGLTAAQKPAFTSKDASFYSVTLEWTDNADTETGYILLRSINDVDYVVVAELDENITTHTDRGLLSGTTYYYQLAATNDVNESSTAFSACVTNATTLVLAAPWTPAYTNTALWLDAADASTVLTSGSSVTNWSDKSGNNRDATQNTVTKQSTYNATGFSGGPTLEFASGDEMTAGIAPNTFSSAINVYMVLSKDSYAYYANHPFLRLSNGKAAPFNGRWSDVSGGYWNYRYVGNGSAESGFGRFNNFPATNTPLLLSIGIDGTTYTEMYNAVNAWSGSHGGTYGDTASDVIIGRNVTGYSISEVVITDSILSATDRQTMEGYLAWKWGMEGNLPAGHLYEDAPPLAPAAAGTVIIMR